jgi:hypothetical protein
MVSIPAAVAENAGQPEGRPSLHYDGACPKEHTRQTAMKPSRSNPNGVVQQSPGLARRQPWVIARQCPSTPTGLRPGGRKTSRLRSPPATTPLGLRAPPSPLPRVVPSVQPWAWLRNRVAVEASHCLCSRPLRRPNRTLKRLSLPTSPAWLIEVDRSYPLLPGQRPDSYQPRATPWVSVRFYAAAGQRPASYGPLGPINSNPDAALGPVSAPQHNESRFQRSEWSLADKPRALPWAGMNDAVGVSIRISGSAGLTHA